MTPSAAEQVEMLLGACFHEHERVAISDDLTRPCAIMRAREYAEAPTMHRSAQNGVWMYVNPIKEGARETGAGDLASYRNALIECEARYMQVLADVFAERLRAAILSGGYVHAIIRTGAQSAQEHAESMDEARRRCRARGLAIGRGIATPNAYALMAGATWRGHETRLIYARLEKLED